MLHMYDVSTRTPAACARGRAVFSLSHKTKLDRGTRRVSGIMQVAASRRLVSHKASRSRKELTLIRFAVPVLCTMLLSGCINITNELQPNNADVQAALMG